MTAGLLMTAIMMTAPDPMELERRLNECSREYSLACATEVLEAVRSAGVTSPDQSLLWAKACLLVAELNRIEFECLQDGDVRTRRLLGKAIDTAAQEGIQALKSAVPAPEAMRLKADLLGAMIRTPYQATRYRKQMIEAAEEALRQDPGNPNAWLTAAKPHLFAPANQGQDLHRAAMAIKKARILAPDLEAALVLEAILHEKSGHTQEATRTWQLLLERNPHCLPAQRALDTQRKNLSEPKEKSDGL